MTVAVRQSVPTRSTRHHSARAYGDLRTRLLRRGARIENVQKLLGHSSIQTTVDIYGHLTMEDARADLRLLEAGV